MKEKKKKNKSKIQEKYLNEEELIKNNYKYNTLPSLKKKTLESFDNESICKQPKWTFAELKIEKFCKNLMKNNNKKNKKSKSLLNLVNDEESDTNRNEYKFGGYEEDGEIEKINYEEFKNEFKKNTLETYNFYDKIQNEIKKKFFFPSRAFSLKFQSPMKSQQIFKSKSKESLTRFESKKKKIDDKHKSFNKLSNFLELTIFEKEPKRRLSTQLTTDEKIKSESNVVNKSEKYNLKKKYFEKVANKNFYFDPSKEIIDKKKYCNDLKEDHKTFNVLNSKEIILNEWDSLKNFGKKPSSTFSTCDKKKHEKRNNEEKIKQSQNKSIKSNFESDKNQNICFLPLKKNVGSLSFIDFLNQSKKKDEKNKLFCPLYKNFDFKESNTKMDQDKKNKIHNFEFSKEEYKKIKSRSKSHDINIKRKKIYQHLKNSFNKELNHYPCLGFYRCNSTFPTSSSFTSLSFEQNFSKNNYHPIDRKFKKMKNETKIKKKACSLSQKCNFCITTIRTEETFFSNKIYNTGKQNNENLSTKGVDDEFCLIGSCEKINIKTNFNKQKIMIKEEKPFSDTETEIVVVNDDNATFMGKINNKLNHFNEKKKQVLENTDQNFEIREKNNETNKTSGLDLLNEMFNCYIENNKLKKGININNDKSKKKIIDSNNKTIIKFKKDIAGKIISNNLRETLESERVKKLTEQNRKKNYTRKFIFRSCSLDSQIDEKLISNKLKLSDFSNFTEFKSVSETSIFGGKKRLKKLKIEDNFLNKNLFYEKSQNINYYYNLFISSSRVKNENIKEIFFPQVIIHDFGEMISIFKEIPQSLKLLKLVNQNMSKLEKSLLCEQKREESKIFKEVMKKYPDLRPSSWTWTNKCPIVTIFAVKYPYSNNMKLKYHKTDLTNEKFFRNDSNHFFRSISIKDVIIKVTSFDILPFIEVFDLIL